MSIGEVLGQLRAEFPDVTISKIRFLESEGLVEPERTSSGYRKFSRDDVVRLRYVLAAQRDHYLPLRVIKARLESLDRGVDPDGPEDAVGAPATAPSTDHLPGPETFVRDPTDVRLARRELLAASGLDEPQLAALESYGLVAAESSGHYDSDALVVARTVAEMARFGIEARHLRPFKAAADREVGLVEQVVSPLVRQRGPDGRARAEQTARELAALSVRLHAALVKAGLRPGLAR